MYDIFHEWGCDLDVGSGGDLALSNASGMISQRVSRRLLTNPGDYIWNLDYGGGLAQFVGTPANATKIQAVVTEQLALESSVPRTPAPKISVSAGNSADGYMVANITYADPSSARPVVISVTTG